MSEGLSGNGRDQKKMILFTKNSCQMRHGTFQEERSLLTDPKIVLQWLSMRILLVVFWPENSN